MTTRIVRVVGLAACCFIGLPGRGSAAVPDVVVYTETATMPPLRAVADEFQSRTGAPVHIFTGAPSLVLAQLAHHVIDDVVVLQREWLDRAEREGLIKPGQRAGTWTTKLVVAQRADGREGAFAAPDLTPAASFDSRPVLAALNVKNPIGAADAREVATLIASGAAAQGLVYLTQVRADARLKVAKEIDPGISPPPVYAAGLNTAAGSLNAIAFLDFLRSDDALAALIRAGMTPAP